MTATSYPPRQRHCSWHRRRGWFCNYNWTYPHNHPRWFPRWWNCSAEAREFRRRRHL